MPVTHYERRAVLSMLADTEETPETVFGPDRERAARELAGHLRGIALCDEEKVLRALRPSRQLERRHLAYRRGVAFLHAAYYDCGLTTADGRDIR